MNQGEQKEHYKILIIEDIPSWQKTLQRYLRAEPFSVTVTANHQDALDLFETDQFDLLIIDISLSLVPHNIDGLRLANKIWQKNQDIKIIFISGIDDPDRRLRSFGFKPVFLLEKKNLDQDEFIKKIYQLLKETPP